MTPDWDEHDGGGSDDGGGRSDDDSDVGRSDDDRGDDDDGGGAGSDDDEGRAPICATCGVTALPAETANVLDATFVCENPDCAAFGEPV